MKHPITWRPVRWIVWAMLIVLAIAGASFAAMRIPAESVGMVRCVEQSGQVDSTWMLDRTNSITCPNNDVVYISRKPTRFEEF